MRDYKTPGRYFYPTFIRALVLAALLPFLSACDDDDGDTESGAGLTSDSGAQSRLYAGNYRGQIAARAHAPGVAQTHFSEPISIVINRNGTLSLTIKEATFGGIVNGNRIQVRTTLPIRQPEGACNTRIAFDGAVSGRKLEGTLSGNGDCIYRGTRQEVTISGNFVTTRR